MTISLIIGARTNALSVIRRVYPRGEFEIFHRQQETKNIGVCKAVVRLPFFNNELDKHLNICLNIHIQLNECLNVRMNNRRK